MSESTDSQWLKAAKPDQHFTDTKDLPQSKFPPITATFTLKPTATLQQWLDTGILAPNPRINNIGKLLEGFEKLAQARLYLAVMTSHEHSGILGSKCVSHGLIPLVSHMAESYPSDT